MKKDIKYYVEKIIKEKITKMTICSKLTWKNIVYYCETDKKKYAVKVYKKNDSAYIRHSVEIAMYKIFLNMKINVPKIYYYGELEEYYILINEWVEAISLKEMVNNNGIIQNKNKLKCLLENYKSIWNLNISDKTRDLLRVNTLENYNTPSMIYTRIEVNEEDMFLKFKEIEHINEIHKIYDKLKKEINPTSTQNVTY